MKIGTAYIEEEIQNENYPLRSQNRSASDTGSIMYVDYDDCPVKIRRRTGNSTPYRREHDLRVRSMRTPPKQIEVPTATLANYSEDRNCENTEYLPPWLAGTPGTKVPVMRYMDLAVRYPEIAENYRKEAMQQLKMLRSPGRDSYRGERATQLGDIVGSYDPDNPYGPSTGWTSSDWGVDMVPDTSRTVHIGTIPDRLATDEEFAAQMAREDELIKRRERMFAKNERIRREALEVQRQLKSRGRNTRIPVRVMPKAETNTARYGPKNVDYHRRPYQCNDHNR